MARKMSRDHFLARQTQETRSCFSIKYLVQHLVNLFITQLSHEILFFLPVRYNNICRMVVFLKIPELLLMYIRRGWHSYS